MAKSKDSLQQLYAEYFNSGGKLSYRDWLKAGMPQSEKQAGQPLSKPQPPIWGFASPFFNKIGQAFDPKRKTEVGNPFFIPDPTWVPEGWVPGQPWEIPPATPTPATPEAAPVATPLDPAFRAWLETIYQPDQIAQLEREGINSGEGKTAWDYYLKYVGPLDKDAPPSRLGNDFKAWLLAQYGEAVARKMEGLDPGNSEYKWYWDKYNQAISPPSEKNYTLLFGNVVSADGKYYDADSHDELAQDEVNRRWTKINAAPSDLAERKFQWEVGQAEVERERQQAEARNKSWVLQNEAQVQASQSAIEKQRNELELIKGRSFPFGDEGQRQRMIQELQASAFESARQSILGSLSSPSDWIKKWEVQNAPNPYPSQRKTEVEQSQGDVANTETRAKMFDQMASESEKLAETLQADPAYGAGPNSEYDASILTQARTDATNYRQAAEAERAKLSVFQGNLTSFQGQPQTSPSQPARGGGAPAPLWLPAFAPGQRAGRAITRENVATPSAQQWAGTPWSVQQGLSGYLDWAGYRPLADILGNMAQMLPNAPGGGSRWSPSIGR